MLLRIANLLSEEQLTSVRAALEGDRALWADGRVTAGYQGAPVKKNQQIDEASPLARELGNLVLAELERNALFISAVLPHKVYPPMFNRFGEGMHFGSHVDGAVRMIPGTSLKLRTDLSATLFLAAPETYEGGELVIDGAFTSESVKLTAGDLVVYSSTARHCVNPVSQGLRVACVFWIQSLIRDDFKREQLFELDRTIQRLTELGSDPESLVRLAGHYHSLLRLWTEI
jgi:PKHD-type hydroxylase